MGHSIVWFSSTGLAAAFAGAIAGYMLMSMRMTILGNGLELAITFGLMGLAWGRNRTRAAITGILLGGFAGMLLGLLRIPADPFLYPMVRALRSQIYLIGSGAALLTAFIIGYLSSENRRWLTGAAAGFGWFFGPFFGAPFYASGRGGFSLGLLLSDSFGVGLRGACTGLALVLCLQFVHRRVEMSQENNASA